MDPLGLVPMLEVAGLSSSNWGEQSMIVPQAMEGLRGLSPPPFLGKICDLVGDPETNHIVSWSKGNNSFVIWDPEAFAIQLLPNYFKHCNLSSFIRQLNTYLVYCLAVSPGADVVELEIEKPLAENFMLQVMLF